MPRLLRRNRTRGIAGAWIVSALSRYIAVTKGINTRFHAVYTRRASFYGKGTPQYEALADGALAACLEGLSQAIHCEDDLKAFDNAIKGKTP